MFDVFCPSHGQRVLLTPRCIEKLENTDDGIVITWRCWCGARGELRTGQADQPAAEPAA
jgi:hypothetical protein